MQSPVRAVAPWCLKDLTWRGVAGAWRRIKLSVVLVQDIILVAEELLPVPADEALDLRCTLVEGLSPACAERHE